MAITADQFGALQFGYLTGDDLLDRCPAALLLKQHEVRPASIAKACETAYTEITSACINRYDIATELTLRDEHRDNLCIKVTAIMAVANALASAQAVSEKMLHEWSANAKFVLSIRNAQANLPGLHPPPQQTDAPTGRPLPYPKSTSGLVNSSFKTLG